MATVLIQDFLPLILIQVFNHYVFPRCLYCLKACSQCHGQRHGESTAPGGYGPQTIVTHLISSVAAVAYVQGAITTGSQASLKGEIACCRTPCTGQRVKRRERNNQFTLGQPLMSHTGANKRTEASATRSIPLKIRISLPPDGTIATAARFCA